MRIDIKPLSMNMAYRCGRRFKSMKYVNFIASCEILLKPIKIPKGDLLFNIEIGVSSKLFDLDNSLKPFIDICQKRYGFNDNRIMEIRAKKTIVKKGHEFISFDIFKC